MKVVVIHGDDTKASNQRFSAIISGIKKRGWEIVRIHPQNLPTLGDVLRGQSLFGGETLYIVDDGSAITSAQLTKLSDLKKGIEGSFLVFYSKKITAAIQKSYPTDTKFEEFELPKVMFTYLEALVPGNALKVVSYLDKLTENQPDELVIAVTARYLRDVYWMSIGGEGLPYPAWRKGKLARQARAFADGQLESIINKLAEIDLSAKRSSASSIELFKLLVLKEF